MADLQNEFPSWGESGEYPADGFFYEGGDQVNEKHLDALWNGVEIHVGILNEAIRDRVRDLHDNVVLDQGLVASAGGGTREVDVSASNDGAYVDGERTGSISAATTSHTANGGTSTRTDIVYVDKSGTVQKSEGTTTVPNNELKIAEVDVATDDTISSIRNYGRDHAHHVASEKPPSGAEPGDIWHDLDNSLLQARVAGSYRHVAVENNTGLDFEFEGGVTLNDALDLNSNALTDSDGIVNVDTQFLVEGDTRINSQLLNFTAETDAQILSGGRLELEADSDQDSGTAGLALMESGDDLLVVGEGNRATIYNGANIQGATSISGDLDINNNSVKNVKGIRISDSGWTSGDFVAMQTVSDGIASIQHWDDSAGDATEFIYYDNPNNRIRFAPTSDNPTIRAEAQFQARADVTHEFGTVGQTQNQPLKINSGDATAGIQFENTDNGVATLNWDNGSFDFSNQIIVGNDGYYGSETISFKTENTATIESFGNLVIESDSNQDSGTSGVEIRESGQTLATFQENTTTQLYNDVSLNSGNIKHITGGSLTGNAETYQQWPAVKAGDTFDGGAGFERVENLSSGDTHSFNEQGRHGVGVVTAKDMDSGSHVTELFLWVFGSKTQIARRDNGNTEAGYFTIAVGSGGAVEAQISSSAASSADWYVRFKEIQGVNWKNL